MSTLKPVLFVCLFFFSAIAESQERIAPSRVDPGHTQWIAGVLNAIQAIKVGMTREELLKVLTIEGGLSTTSQRTYVYPECPYIKVDVKFAAFSREEERPTDKIVEISRPYLAASIMD